METYPDVALRTALDGVTDPPPRGFRAGLLLMLAALVLWPLSALPPYAATVSIGFLGTLAVLLCLRFQYRGIIPLNIGTCLMAGTALQYLLAPALIRIVSDDFTASYWRETAIRHFVKDYYGPAMIVVMVFLGATLLTMGLFSGPFRQKLVKGRIGSVFSRRTSFLVVLMIVNVWTARATLLSVGAFYHVHHTKFVESDAYSALAQIDLGLGMMVVAFLWTGVFASGSALLFAIPYTFLDIGWNFVAGNREPIAFDFIVIVLTSYISRNRFPWKLVIIVSPMLLVLFGFMSTFRYAANKMDAHSIDLGAVISAIRNEAGEERSGPSFLVTALVRLNDLDSIAAIYGGTPDQQPYLRGETWANIPQAMIPRQFTKDKKPVVLPINTWFFRHEGGTSPTTAPGEGYLNFGWMGVIVTGVVCGLILRGMEWIFSNLLWNGAILPIYVAALGIFARHHAQGLGVWITSSTKIVIFLFIVHLLTRPSKDRYREKIAEAEAAIPAGPGVPPAIAGYHA